MPLKDEHPKNRTNTNRHKRKINWNTIIVGDFNTLLHQWTDPLDRKIIKATETLNDTIEQLDIIDIFRMLHQKKPKIYILFRCTWKSLKD